ncbi:GAF domain-containing protein [Bordetella parapertussis]|uniref:histidine kinase n=2 Tax=Bordetella parapertussis TaxID=519 RepID=Q7W6K8_BORPA|nr:GAF domain-containing protein [Bordetella parapertussis]AOB39922.1 ATPase [Bordetella parapertussis]AUL43931.1 ATPase [Bordetella parapertussis]AWP62557.1 ATPase [Bordetella parapertussis]AWP70057.1 ATPase [Bordetella parapertussis]AWP89940.1 ATPase [Bordetella parapertussis]
MLRKGDRVSSPWTNTLARLEDERVMLQRIAAGVPLTDVLLHVMQAVEAQSSVELLTSIAFVDDSGMRLRHVATPSLPAAYVQATDGAAIGPGVASWGAAAFLGTPVYVEDLTVHPNWPPWREAATQHGLRACWSTPIKATDGRTLGVFSNYYRQPRLPTREDIEAIALVTRTAALAIERHLTEQALRNSSVRWRGMFERMQEGFFLAEAQRDSTGSVDDFTLLEINPAFETQSGLAVGQTLGPMLRVMSPAAADSIMRIFVGVIESGEPAQFEVEAPGPPQACYECRAGKEGHDRVAALFLNVTARKLAESELWERQYRKNFLLTLGDRMREIHQQDQIEQMVCEELGRHLELGAVAVMESVPQRGDRIAASWGPRPPYDGRSMLESAPLTPDYYEAVRKGRTAYLSPYLAGPAGNQQPSAIVVPLRRWGRADGTLLVRPDPTHPLKGTDIAFIEEAAERMCEAIERSQYARVLEQRVEHAIAERDRIWRLSPELLAVADHGGRLVSVNPAVRAILGWSPEQFLAMGLDEGVHPEDLASMQATLEAEPAEGMQPVRHLESRLLHKDGSYHWITWSLSRAEGNVYLAGRDDTDLKAQAEVLRQTEDALRQSQKLEAVGRLTGGIAHDFNNMLQGISGALYLIDRKLRRSKPEEVGKYVRTAQESTDRAARLTQRLLTFSRQQAIDPQVFDPGDILRSMDELFRRYTGEQVRLTLKLPAQSWRVRCDMNQFENAVLNLVINACDAMPAGGDLEIEVAHRELDAAAVQTNPCAEAGEFVEVCVSDMGCGMAPDVLARVFEPFFTTKPMGQGTGLGLSMIYGFAQQAGGMVTIASVQAEGTAVRLFLPRHVGEPVALPAPESSEPPAAPAHAAVVALVEDDEHVRDMVRAALEELNLTVLTAADGDAGHRLLQSDARIDLLLSDVGLPGMNGHALAQAARALRPALRIILMTGYADERENGWARQERDVSLIRKPFSPGELTARVCRLLAASQD